MVAGGGGLHTRLPHTLLHMKYVWKQVSGSSVVPCFLVTLLHPTPPPPPPPPALLSHPSLRAGMVRETGEATERFLRSMAAGDPAATQELQQAAAAGLAAVSACQQAATAHMCLSSMSNQMVERAQQLNRQLAGIMEVLRDAPGGLLMAAAAAGGAGGGGGHLEGGAGAGTMAGGGGGGGGEVGDGGRGGAPAAAGPGDSEGARQLLERLCAVLSATEALQQMAAQLQAAVAAAAAGATSSAAAAAAGAVDGEERAAEDDGPLQVMEEALSGTLSATAQHSMDLEGRRRSSVDMDSAAAAVLRRRSSMDYGALGGEGAGRQRGAPRRSHSLLPEVVREALAAEAPAAAAASMAPPPFAAHPAVGGGGASSSSSAAAGVVVGPACPWLAQCEKEQACRKQ